MVDFRQLFRLFLTVNYCSIKFEWLEWNPAPLDTETTILPIATPQPINLYFPNEIFLLRFKETF